MSLFSQGNPPDVTVLLHSKCFFFTDKGKPLIYCYKICPLYCSKHATKRYDHDESFLTYLHDNPYDTEVPKHDFPHWKPATKSTKAPTTTTKKPIYLDYNPYFIDDGSGDFDHIPHYHWNQKPTEKTTTEAPKTTTKPVYLDHYPYFIDVPEIYDYPPELHFWKPKPTTTTTSTTKKPPVYLDHNPYYIWPDYDYSYPHHHHHHHGSGPRPTTSTTTVAPTTTEEPTFICQVCKAKCGDKFS
ncbi:uncharacterized protein LOC125231322 [Leguminivora glycinivorella]|uniref:uncharacterized protein LOC125231322 n=1 Tax=Leguminivora glycinivorella TaxID=1035111 RepID=UPI00200C1384|nr:uncharacterized protein LOC125231322 [Leguminivora glycinivorella]